MQVSQRTKHESMKKLERGEDESMRSLSGHLLYLRKFVVVMEWFPGRVTHR